MVPSVPSAAAPTLSAHEATGPEGGQIASGRPYESEVDANSPNRNLAPISACLDSQERLLLGG